MTCSHKFTDFIKNIIRFLNTINLTRILLDIKFGVTRELFCFSFPWVVLGRWQRGTVVVRVTTVGKQATLLVNVLSVVLVVLVVLAVVLAVVLVVATLVVSLATLLVSVLLKAMVVEIVVTTTLVMVVVVQAVEVEAAITQIMAMDSLQIEILATDVGRAGIWLRIAQTQNHHVIIVGNPDILHVIVLSNLLALVLVLVAVILVVEPDILLVNALTQMLTNAINVTVRVTSLVTVLLSKYFCFNLAHLDRRERFTVRCYPSSAGGLCSTLRANKKGGKRERERDIFKS
jgi:hypothetical protein